MIKEVAQVRRAGELGSWGAGELTVSVESVGKYADVANAVRSPILLSPGPSTHAPQMAANAGDLLARPPPFPAMDNSTFVRTLLLVALP